jgi:CheY-like chemotaxis protein
MQERKAVMVVEDDESIRELMVEILRESGYDVIECQSGEQALSRVDAFRPAVITLDLAMPSMDGLQFLRQLRNRRNEPEIPVVVVSAAPEFLRDRLLQGAVAAVGKPFHVDEFLNAVEDALKESERPSA